MNIRRTSLLVVLVALLALFTTFGAVSAQSGLTPGSAQVSSLSAAAPIGLFTFQGTQGDLAQVRLVALTPGMGLSASLQSPSQQPLGSSVPDLGVPGGALISARLPSTGIYSLLVGGGAGDFVIALDILSTSTASVLNTAAAQDVSYSGLTPSIGTFTSSLNSPLSVIIGAPAEARYSATLVDGLGAVVGTARSIPQACFGVAAGDSAYTLLISGLAADSVGSVTVSFALGCGGGTAVAPIAPVVNQPVATQQVAGPAPTVCTATSAGAVNIRSGAGTEFPVVAQLTPGAGLPIIGVTNNGWYQVQGAFGTGFVSQTVVTASGPCGNLPVVASPAPPAGSVNPPAATQEVAPPAVVTATPTQVLNGAAPTAPVATQEVVQPTATVEVPVAPPDSNYSLTVPLDGNASISDFVSFPNGDTEDVVSYDTSGLNNSVALPGGQGTLTFALSCFGTGTQNITFRIDGQDFACGQTFTRIVNADSDTGAIRIIANGGTNTYVQWVVNASLPRVN